jgi:SAM-dependent methyltransferase
MPKPMPSDRNPEAVRHHYEVEKELAARLRLASREERRVLYSSLYDELFRRLPDHPQVTTKQDPGVTAFRVGLHLAILRRFLRSDSTFMELGPGDCSLSLAVARLAARCYAVDVSTEITHQPDWPENLQLIICDGSSVPVPDGSVDVAYSNQLMEHLHPDDARQQLANIHRSLRPGGRYVCRTPNRLSGPHDVSAHFDPVATGFHLREYANGELASLFRSAGFQRVEAFVLARGSYHEVPLPMLCALEWGLDRLPRGTAQGIATTRGLELLLGVNLVGTR